MKYLLQIKNITYKYWAAFFIACIGAIFMVSIVALIWTDTYSVLHPANTRYLDEPNRNFLKVEHILSHPDRYDGFIFGSSRVGSILPGHLEGGRFYNMTYSEGIPREHLLNLRLFLKSGVKIKKVYLGLDEFSYQVSFGTHQQRWLTKAHPLATQTSWLEFYKFYFFRLPTRHDQAQFIKKLTHPDQTITMDITDQDQFYSSFLNRMPNFRSDDPIYLKPTHYSGNTLSDTLEDIRAIVALCKQHRIELTVFINPIHHTTYQDTNKQLLYQFKRSLAAITPYYDFSGPNSITQNNRNFVDTSHYVIDVGNEMIETMSAGMQEQ